jgi:hypothetical protein
MSITRVDYRERQRLTAADLLAEQEYRIGAAGRHHLGPHDWGVVRGLQIEVVGPGDVIVWPGVAIDGYGREIIVPEPARVRTDTVAAAAIWDLLLYYCDRPEQVPPGRICKDEPAPRTSQRHVLRVVPFEAVIEREPFPLDDARAGGHGGWTPWPVLLAREGANGAEADTSATRYVRHRAAVIRAPSRRSTLQLGLRNREDLYHFLLSTRGSTSPAEPRLGIDRDGDVHVWRSLVLTGTGAALQTVQGQALVAIEAKMTAGIGATLRFEGRVDLARRRVEGAFVRLGAGEPELGSTLAVAGVRAKPKPFVAGPSQTFVSLTPLVPLSPLVRRSRQITPAVAGPAAAALVAPDAGDQAVAGDLSAFGGALKIEAPADREVAAIVPTCGDVERDRPGGDAVGPVVQCRPGAAPDLDPSFRAIQAVTVSKPDELVPRTEFRIIGGGQDQSDDSSRVAFGQLDAAWTSVVEMTGAGRVRLPGKNASLEVTGALYLPAIGPSDPLLPELQALAFMVGLPKATSPTVTIAIDAPADATQIRRGVPFSYTVTLSAAATVKRAAEAMVGAGGPADLSFRRIANPTVGGKQIADAITRHRAGTVKLRVVCLLQVGQTSRMVVGEKELNLRD